MIRKTGEKHRISTRQIGFLTVPEGMTTLISAKNDELPSWTEEGDSASESALNSQ